MNDDRDSTPIVVRLDASRRRYVEAARHRFWHTASTCCIAFLFIFVGMAEVDVLLIKALRHRPLHLEILLFACYVIISVMLYKLYVRSQADKIWEYSRQYDGGSVALSKLGLRLHTKTTDMGFAWSDVQWFSYQRDLYIIELSEHEVLIFSDNQLSQRRRALLIHLADSLKKQLRTRKQRRSGR